jgi:quercetin dioxygenase-like cupin family protein
MAQKGGHGVALTDPRTTWDDMETQGIIGDVKSGMFRRLYGGTPGETARLTTIAPEEAISPETREIRLQDLEGRLLVVHGMDQGSWIYSARILDVHSGGAPPASEFIRTLFRAGVLGPGVQGIKSMAKPEPKAGDPTKFSKGVTQETLLELQVPNGMRVHRITYPPRGHTHWHWHEGEQALYGLSGTGLVQQDGQASVTLDEGTIIYVTPGVRHWHGAMLRHDDFVHLAFTASGRTEWQEVVTEEEYEAATG